MFTEKHYFITYRIVIKLATNLKIIETVMREIDAHEH